MIDFARARRIPVHSVQIVRAGKLALDAYFYPYDGTTRHDVASVTKSVTSILVGMAIERGKISSVTQSAQELVVPGRASADSRPNVEDLLTMRSGWDCGFEPKEARLFEMRRSSDWAQFMFDLPRIAEPGTRWGYCSGNCHVLSVALTRTTGTNALGFARSALFEPLEIQDAFWSKDHRGNNHGWGDLQLHPWDMAKLGQLFLQRGRWSERQLISENWVKESTRAHVAKTSNADGYGYYWWVKGADFPGMYEAVGRGGQRITVWPAKEMVIVFTGGGFEPGDLAPFILKALKSDQALAPNPASVAKLKASLAEAQKAPAPRTPKISKFAKQISGKTYALTQNELDLATLKLDFDGEEQAAVRFERLGQKLSSPVGLDGVERFSKDKLVELPFACKGEWVSDRLFVLELDRVAGISAYQFRIEFAEDAQSIHIELKERSGLSGQVFDGHARQ